MVIVVTADIVLRNTVRMGFAWANGFPNTRSIS